MMDISPTILANYREVSSAPIRAYLWVALVNGLKTAFPSLLSIIRALYHNIISLKEKNGKWFKCEYGSTFKLRHQEGAKVEGTTLPTVCLVKLKRSTSSSLIEALAQDVTNLVKAHFKEMKAKNPIDIVLLGHSMGGIIALEAAKKLEEEYPGVRVITVFSPNYGSNLLKALNYNSKSILHNNFHPDSPFVKAGYAAIACRRFIAAKDHIIPRTKEELNDLAENGSTITNDGHNTFAVNPKTVAKIKEAVFSPTKSKDQKTYVFCIHGLGGTPGGLYPLAKAISG